MGPNDQIIFCLFIEAYMFMLYGGLVKFSSSGSKSLN